MADIKKYKEGQTLYYRGRAKCTVIQNTLAPGGTNANEAILWLRDGSGAAIAVPVLNQHLFVTEKQIGILQKWNPGLPKE